MGGGGLSQGAKGGFFFSRKKKEKEKRKNVLPLNIVTHSGNLIPVCPFPHPKYHNWRTTQVMALAQNLVEKARKISSIMY